MCVKFIKKDYGYKVVDKYGDKLGEIDTSLLPPSFSSSNKCSWKTIKELKEIVKFMEGLDNHDTY